MEHYLLRKLAPVLITKQFNCHKCIYDILIIQLCKQKHLSISEPKAGIVLCMAFLLKEKCFWLAPINGGSDCTDRVAAAITQFAGGSTKYFGTHHAEFPEPKRDPA